MSKYNALLHHEVLFFPIEYQVCLLTPLENQAQILQAIIIGCSKNREVIHENFNTFLHHVRKYCHHAPLKCGRCVAQPEWHSSICKCAIGTSEGGLFLVFGINMDLVVTGETIKETIVVMAGQPFQHLIYEREWEVVLSGGVRIPVVFNWLIS